MNSYKLLFDWQISMPDNWQGEYDEENGEYIRIIELEVIQVIILVFYFI